MALGESFKSCDRLHLLDTRWKHGGGYNESLCADDRIKQDVANPSGAFLADHYDMFTLDTTIIATALGQLIDEGTIDPDVKPFVHVAINRQLHPSVLQDADSEKILLAIRRVVDAA